MTISQHCWNEYLWCFFTNIEFKKEEYENLLEHLPTLLSYIEKFKKTCIDFNKDGRKFDRYCHAFQLIQLLRKHTVNFS